MPYLSSATQSLPFAADPGQHPALNTSRQGAEAIAADARSLRARYVRALYSRGAVGLTDQEAADACHIERTTLIPRRHELGQDVAWTGATRHHVVRKGD